MRYMIGLSGSDKWTDAYHGLLRVANSHRMMPYEYCRCTVRTCATMWHREKMNRH